MQDRPGANQAGIDPFDVLGDDDEGPWNPADAEALTRIYEESDAALVRTSPRSEAGAAPSAAHEPAAPEAPIAMQPLYAVDPAPEAHGDAAIDDDRAWLDQRLSDIAARIERSLSELKGDFSVDSLGVRFDVFEERMGSVLGDVATRSDVESLRLIEGQIQELTMHLEQTEQQLGRLDGIEQQLQAVIEHLSSGAEGGGHDLAAVAESPDFATLARSTAEEVAKRFAATTTAAGGDPRLDELGSLLRSMIHDRRQSDEQTYTMLDTVQQAMIRLLDRIDALEMAQVQMVHAPAEEPVSTPSEAAIQDFGAPDHDDHAPVLPVRGEPIAPMPAAAAAAPTAPAGVRAEADVSGINKLRQDFIADAQRAKMRAASAAASESDVAAAPAAGGAARTIRNMPRPAAPAPVEAASAPAGSRRQRLTALALCLVIAVSGAALFAKSRNKAPEAAAPAAVTETAPAAPAAAVPQPAPADQAVEDTPANIEVPAAAPKAEGDSGLFQLPGDTSIEVPGASAPAAVPAPQPEAAAPAQPAPSSGAAAGAGPQTNEDALNLDGESPESEVLENRRDPERPQGAQGLAPQGILLQDSGRQPSAHELVQLQSQQNFAALSSRLGTSAAQLRPADLMPEEVARYVPAAASAAVEDMPKAMPAALPVAAMPGETIDMPVPGAGKTFTQLALPPATVGPLSLRMAAANGDPSAAFEVGARLAEGKGTQQNFPEAIVWYQKSASQGFAQSQYRLGTLYERGLGVKADLARAQMWYQRAAEQGHIKAMHNLAVLAAGRTSGQPDYVTAAQWFQSAAEYGLADSQYNLAVLHENGLGVAKDPVQAYKWYTLAGRGGDGESLKRRDALKAQLSVEQKLEAEKEAAVFEPKRSVALVNDARVAGEDWKKRQDG